MRVERSNFVRDDLVQYIGRTSSFYAQYATRRQSNFLESGHIIPKTDDQTFETHLALLWNLMISRFGRV